MKKQMLMVLTAVLLLFSSSSFACVGKTLIIGALASPNEQLLAQLMAVIINERTGTTVNVQYYDDQQKLYAAVAKKEVNIIAENTGRALQRLGKETSGDAEAIYAEVKDAYRKELQLVLLKPFGSAAAGDKPFMDVAAIAETILIEYPALPRVIEKLAGIVQEKSYPQLLAAVESGDKPNQVARDFLKKKRFI
ncbi:MAG: glycine betaine ABC transporter substrate-binding protein [Desulfobulbaceae bacterium]